MVYNYRADRLPRFRTQQERSPASLVRDHLIKNREASGCAGIYRVCMCANLVPSRLRTVGYCRHLLRGHGHSIAAVRSVPNPSGPVAARPPRKARALPRCRITQLMSQERGTAYEKYHGWWEHVCARVAIQCLQVRDQLSEGQLCAPETDTTPDACMQCFRRHAENPRQT